MDFETGEPIQSAAEDILELSIQPGSGRLHFRLIAGMNQPQCHSCEVESDVPAAKSSRRPWSSGTDESRAAGAISVAADSIVLDVSDHNQTYHCGMGAFLGGAYTFHRHGLRLASTPEDP